MFIEWLYCVPGPFQESLPGDDYKGNPFPTYDLLEYLRNATERLALWRDQEVQCVREFLLHEPRNAYFDEETGTQKFNEEPMKQRQFIADSLEFVWDNDAEWYPRLLIEHQRHHPRSSPYVPEEVHALYWELQGEDALTEFARRHWEAVIPYDCEGRRSIDREGMLNLDLCRRDDYIRWMDGEDLWFRYSRRIANEYQRKLWLANHGTYWELLDDDRSFLTPSDRIFEDRHHENQREFMDSGLDLMCIENWDDLRFRMLFRWLLAPTHVLNFVLEGFQAGLRHWCKRLSHFPVGCETVSDFAALDELATLVLSNCRPAFKPEGPSSMLGHDDLALARWMYPLMTATALPSSMWRPRTDKSELEAEYGAEFDKQTDFESLMEFVGVSNRIDLTRRLEKFGKNDDKVRALFLAAMDDVSHGGDGDPVFTHIYEFESKLEESPQIVSADRECRVIGLRFIQRAMQEAERFGRKLFDSAPTISDENEALAIVHRITEDCLANLPEDAMPVTGSRAIVRSTAEETCGTGGQPSETPICDDAAEPLDPKLVEACEANGAEYSIAVECREVLRVNGAKDLSVDDVLKRANRGGQRVRKALRALQSLDEYHGFKR